jgi:arylsulfatase A-like enzyme
VRRFHLRALAVFGALQALALTAHYYGPSPFGGPLVAMPSRYLPEAIGAHLALIAAIVLLFGVAHAAAGERLHRALAALCAGALALLVVFNQFDLEIVRWLGQHVNLSYLQTYLADPGDLQVVRRALASDVGPTLAAAAVMAAAVVAAVRLAAAYPRLAAPCRRRVYAQLLLGIAVLSFGVYKARYSVTRWRKVRPPLVLLASDAYRALVGADRPRDPARAGADLLTLAAGEALGGGAAPAAPADRAYPLWREHGAGSIPLAAWRALPLARRPNVIVVAFETWRGWESGLAPGLRATSRTPELDAVLSRRAAYFPWTLAHGFPSVEGATGIFLGTWPDHQKVFFSEFLHIRSRSLPEILRAAGYRSWALMGADPAFDSSTPWIKRWYDAYEYDAALDDDALLVDRFLARYDELTRAADAPVHALLWTVSTHPPFDLPERRGFTNPKDTDARYAQAAAFAGREVARLLEALARRPDWDRTVVVVVGDHAFPNNFQRAHPELVCELSPGHLWTNLALLGGFPRLPPPGRRDEVVGHVDIAPTLLSVLDLDAPNHFVGRPLDADPAAPDAAAGPVATPRPILAFRFGDGLLRVGDRQVCFSTLGDATQSFTLDPRVPAAFGLLSADAVPAASAEPPPGLPIDRYRDAALAYGRLLRENRLVPPGR